MESMSFGQYCQLHAKGISMTCLTDGENICLSCVRSHQGHHIEPIKQQQQPNNKPHFLETTESPNAVSINYCDSH